MISVVTPTLDAAEFLRATLESVASLGRDDIEHIVVDGGSTDETLEIAAACPHVRVLHKPGMRQTAAMNAGAREATGEFIIFLNADDVLSPRSVDMLLGGFSRDTDVVYGDARHIDGTGAVIDEYPTRPFDRAALLEGCFICQAATMVRRESFWRFGGFDETLDYAMDYDLWLRMSPSASFAKVAAHVADVRLHRTAKSVAFRTHIYREAFRVLLKNARYVPYTWVYGYADLLLQPDDQVFLARRPSVRKVIYALALGVRINARQPLRAIGDWIAHRSLGRRAR